MARYKPTTRTFGVLSAIETMYDDAHSLGAELREIFDNAPESLQQTARLQTFDETATLLEDLEMPDAPDGLPEMECVVSVMLRGGKKQGQESRAVQASNIASHGKAAVDEIRSWCDEQESECDEAEETDKSNPEGASEGALKLTAEMRQERRDLLDELRTWCDEVEGHAEEIENAEFPGMFG